MRHELGVQMHIYKIGGPILIIFHRILCQDIPTRSNMFLSIYDLLFITDGLH